MEYCGGHGFLEELLAVKSDSWEANIPVGLNHELYSTNGWSSFDSFLENSFSSSSNYFLEEFSLPIFDHHQTPSHELYCPLGLGGDEISATDNSSNNIKPENTSPLIPTQEEYSLLSILNDHEEAAIAAGFHNMGRVQESASCKMEPQVPIFDMGRSNSMCLERKSSKIKKLDGQPSKNLMAERRRRKRLNDRLSMLRSVVPKISKMDRASILGDTIDYMKELIERINNMQEKFEVGGTNGQQLNLMTIFKDVKPKEILLRNSPKFDVERRKMDTQVEVRCAGKPGLLLSTMSTLEALGLEIQQCVVSCFNDFALQASCSEGLEQRGLVSAEYIKQALFRNAGYGGRCEMSLD